MCQKHGRVVCEKLNKLKTSWFFTVSTMDKSTDNIFLRAAFGGEIQIPSTSRSPSPRLNISAVSSSDTMEKRKGKTLRRPNAPHHKYNALEDSLILRGVKLKGRDWRAVLAFLKKTGRSSARKGRSTRTVKSKTRNYRTA